MSFLGEKYLLRVPGCENDMHKTNFHVENFTLNELSLNELAEKDSWDLARRYFFL
jgi:hypothetical protein